jgi:hypothetical protein
MRASVLSAFAIALLVLTATAQSDAPVGRPAGGEPPHPVGAVHREVADSSPVASATLSPIQNPVKAGSITKVHFVLENRSDHAIKYIGFPVLDVRDENGNVAPETINGRGMHFFSPRHTEGGAGNTYIGGGAYTLRGIIPVHGKLEEDGFVNSEYELTPGTYTVVGYVCGMKEGPECFKTNSVKVTVE